LFGAEVVYVAGPLNGEYAVTGTAAAESHHSPRAVHVPLHDVAAQKCARRGSALKIDSGILDQRAERGTRQRLFHRGRFNPTFTRTLHSETHAIHGDTLTVVQLRTRKCVT